MRPFSNTVSHPAKRGGGLCKKPVHEIFRINDTLKMR
uniref:Uncharacterized protein n=1 Tax=Neisseria meningitidis alpha153 TaxID=663926 RepID=C6SG24_NEIME|nr:hypothetical protein predicted by Glimmer/Critica [Neisseria meningitidis alpha153]